MNQNKLANQHSLTSLNTDYILVGSAMVLRALCEICKESQGNSAIHQILNEIGNKLDEEQVLEFKTRFADALELYRRGEA